MPVLIIVQQVIQIFHRYAKPVVCSTSSTRLHHHAGPDAPSGPPDAPAPPPFTPAYVRTLICWLSTLNGFIVTTPDISANFSLGFTQQMTGFLNGLDVEVIYIADASYVSLPIPPPPPPLLLQWLKALPALLEMVRQGELSRI